MINMLLHFLEKNKPYFEKGPFRFFGPLYEATDKFFFTEAKSNLLAPFVRDVCNLKRVMFLVVIAVFPAFLFGIWNVGFQISHTMETLQGVPLDSWQTTLMNDFHIPWHTFLGQYFHGALYVIPIVFVSYATGAFWEVLFDCVRKKEITESFLVTGMLFALVLPPTTPLWLVALGISFGVIFGKMIFGGTGFNIVNPAFLGRAFLFFAYPSYMSSDKVWMPIDGITTATPLSAMSSSLPSSFSLTDAFLGIIPGSIGETSFLLLSLGGILLLIFKVASWRIVLGVILGTLLASLLASFLGPQNIMAQMPFWGHMVLGGWALGTFFMATDPVTAPSMNGAKLWYGFFIGFLTIVIRVWNPSYPEGMMLAVLLMNFFAPFLDWFAVRIFVAKRRKRYVE